MTTEPEPKREYVVFFQFAKEHCCNYSASVPWGTKHYCWLEPQETKHACVLQFGKHCRWFLEAVLPLDPALQAEWQRLKKLEADPDAPPQARRERTCPSCGTQFLPRSNRQLYCPDCGKQRRLEQLKKRVRRHRAK